MKDKDLWCFISNSLQQDIPVVLLIVVVREGSSPGRVGFKMGVTEDDMVGTIGGGIIECNMVNMARAMLKKDDFVPLLQKQIHNPEDSVKASGMVCGGSQSIVLYPCRKNDLVCFQLLTGSLETNAAGILRLSPGGISFTPNTCNGNKYKFNLKGEDDWQYEENTGLISTLYIIGAGHVGSALSRVFSPLDFHIVVLDERQDVKTFKNNTYDHEKIICSYDNIGEHIPSGEKDYAVIMTPDHQADELVLRQLVEKNLYYLGMMGSASKVKKIMKRLEQDGIPSNKLQQVRTPVGLPIKSHTAEEIAISIAAEIIAIKNNAPGFSFEPGFKRKIINNQ